VNHSTEAQIEAMQEVFACDRNEAIARLIDMGDISEHDPEFAPPEDRGDGQVPLTPAQVRDAVEQVKVTCNIRISNNEHEPFSLREALYHLGFGEIDADEVILSCAEGGFEYHIDPIIRIKDPNDPKRTERPSRETCVWGPDQLLSRLECLRHTLPEATS
jgi:hypothetical protein